MTPFVYIGPPTTDHKVNRGFRGVVTAAILSNQTYSLLSETVGQTTKSGAPSWEYKKLPAGATKAIEYVTRNSDISGC
jgi:hypothetical protein